MDENFDGDAAEEYRDDLESEGDEDLDNELGIDTEGTWLSDRVKRHSWTRLLSSYAHCAPLLSLVKRETDGRFQSSATRFSLGCRGYQCC